MFLALWLAIGLVFTFLARETHGKTVPRDAEASAPWRCRSLQHLAPDWAVTGMGGKTGSS